MIIDVAMGYRKVEIVLGSEGIGEIGETDPYCLPTSGVVVRG